MEQDYLVFMIRFFSVSFLVFNLSFGIFIVSLNIRYFYCGVEDGMAERDGLAQFISRLNLH